MQWKPCVVGGLALGVTVALWQIISISVEATDVFVPVAFALQIVSVVAVLAQTRGDHRYGQQLASSVVLSAVASVLIFVGSLITTTLLFPEALEQLRVSTRGAMVRQGASGAEIESALANLTAVGQAWAGVVGTMVSGPLIAALAGIGLRRRS